jgi:hypothetical protein
VNKYCKCIKTGYCYECHHARVDVQLKLDELRERANALFEAADKFASKFGSKKHPVENWYEDAFVKLECILAEWKKYANKR